MKRSSQCEKFKFTQLSYVHAVSVSTAGARVWVNVSGRAIESATCERRAARARAHSDAAQKCVYINTARASGGAAASATAESEEGATERPSDKRACVRRFVTFFCSPLSRSSNEFSRSFHFSAFRTLLRTLALARRYVHAAAYVISRRNLILFACGMNGPSETANEEKSAYALGNDNAKRASNRKASTEHTYA